jgi:hypothetical protein
MAVPILSPMLPSIVYSWSSFSSPHAHTIPCHMFTFLHAIFCHLLPPPGRSRQQILDPCSGETDAFFVRWTWLTLSLPSKRGLLQVCEGRPAPADVWPPLLKISVTGHGHGSKVAATAATTTMALDWPTSSVHAGLKDAPRVCFGTRSLGYRARIQLVAK